MNTNNSEFITVTIDKSHIITIGERLYTESIEFVRENDPKNPRQAFERQSKLLRDAFIDKSV
jgi:hypothetical protein